MCTRSCTRSPLAATPIAIPLAVALAVARRAPTAVSNPSAFVSLPRGGDMVHSTQHREYPGSTQASSAEKVWQQIMDCIQFATVMTRLPQALGQAEAAHAAQQACHVVHHRSQSKPAIGSIDKIMNKTSCVKHHSGNTLPPCAAPWAWMSKSVNTRRRQLHGRPRGQT